MATASGRDPYTDPYISEGHEYFPLPPGVRVCDDHVSGGSFFLYRDGHVVCDEDYAERATRVMEERFGTGLVSPDVAVRGLAGAVVLRLNPTAVTGVETVEVVRYMQGSRPPEEPRVGFHHVLTVQSHVKWSPGVPPRPRLTALDDLPTGPSLPGTGVRVGIVDTGWNDQAWFSRPPESAGDVRDLEEVLDQDRDRSLDFEAGHGTFIAGTVLQHAPGATLVIRRLDDRMGCVDDAQAALVVQELLATGVDVLNLSFGGYTSDNQPWSLLCRVLTKALDDNPDLVVVAAAGNDGIERMFYPAALKRVIAVGALDAESRSRAWFSNHGGWVDAWTRGEDLDSTFVSWPDSLGELRLQRPPAPNVNLAELTPNDPFVGWATWSGTSFAAPRVAAAIAAELKRDSRTPRQVVFDLVHGSSDRVESGAHVEPLHFVS